MRGICGGNKCAVALDVGSWQHVAGAFDGSGMKLYVNGKLRLQSQGQLCRPTRIRFYPFADI